LRSLEARAKEEQDPLWRNWFLEIDNRRKKEADRKTKPLITSVMRKDDGQKDVVIARRQADPTVLKTLLKTTRKHEGSVATQDLLWIREVWAASTGPDIAQETEVYAFKNGVLTISVFSGALLQEIRQFHADSIIADLRDIWQASIPLLKIQYRPGKR
jgi:predicted nucleic acid-binding Zn ribbon protein